MSGRPNVFLLSADSVRADAFAEPIERLGAATGGTRFRNAVSPASHTASSVPALATGRFADGRAPDRRPGRAPPGEPRSIVDAFRAAGYETVLLTDNPLFAPSLGEADDGATSPLIRFDDALPRSVTRAAERAYFGVVRPIARRLGLLGPYYRPATILHRIARDRLADADRPVFCWIHYMDAHTPYWPPPSGSDRGDAADVRTAARSRSAAVGAETTDADLAAIRKLYRRTCDRLGAELGRFVGTLRADGLFDPAGDVLAVTADHGECLDHDRGLVGHVPPASWESLIHVPLLIARPDWPERSVDGQVSLVDLPRMLGAPRGGEDLASASGALDPDEFVRDHALTVARTLGASGYVRGVRSGDGRKLFGRRTADGIDVVRTAFEVGDPGGERVLELRPPAAEPTDPDDLDALLARHGGPTGEATGRPAHDESTLRALGYLE